MRLRPAFSAILLFPLLASALTARTGNDCAQLDVTEKNACFQEVAAGRTYQQRMVVDASAESSPAGPGKPTSIVEAGDTPMLDSITTIVVGPKGDTTRTIEIRRCDVERKNLVVATTRLFYTTITVMAVGLAGAAIGLILAITD